MSKLPKPAPPTPDVLCMKRDPETGDPCKLNAGHRGYHDPLGISPTEEDIANKNDLKVEPTPPTETQTIHDWVIWKDSNGVWWKSGGKQIARVFEVAAPTERVETRPDYQFLAQGFIDAMNDIGRYGHEKYAEQSFQHRRLKGDTSRGEMERTKTEAIGHHVGEHYAMYSRGELHDHFGTLKHQLAAVAFNAMMEYYFAGLDIAAVAPSPAGESQELLTADQVLTEVDKMCEGRAPNLAPYMRQHYATNHHMAHAVLQDLNLEEIHMWRRKK